MGLRFWGIAWDGCGSKYGRGGEGKALGQVSDEVGCREQGGSRCECVEGRSGHSGAGRKVGGEVRGRDEASEV